MRVAAVALSFAVLVSCAAPRPGFSGTVQTEYVSVGSQVGGRVIATEVAAGQTVKRGAVIVRLDSALPTATYDQAVAQGRAAQAALRVLQTGTLPSQIEQARGSSLSTGATYTQTIGGAQDRIRAARAAVADARANERLTEKNYARSAALAATGDVSLQSLDQARAARDQARATAPPDASATRATRRCGSSGRKCGCTSERRRRERKPIGGRSRLRGADRASTVSNSQRRCRRRPRARRTARSNGLFNR